jgi:hypothetical protein
MTTLFTLCYFWLESRVYNGNKYLTGASKCLVMDI